MRHIFSRHMLLLALRLLLGFVFLWAFLDKTFGFGFATKASAAWIRGGSPTTGFLTHAVQGPFADFFHSLAGSAIVDWLFMIGLFVVGVTLVTNRLVKWGCMVGIILMALMYVALLWPANNPFIDEHVIYAVLLAYIGSYHTFSFKRHRS